LSCGQVGSILAIADAGYPTAGLGGLPPDSYPATNLQKRTPIRSTSARARHDAVKQGLITPTIEVYRGKGVCAYVGDGPNRWPAAHVLDVARLYRLAIEKAEPNAKYHAVAEEGVSMRDMAEAIGRRLKLPVKSTAPEVAQAFFGWLGMFAAYDMPASSAQTRKQLGWEPTGPGLIADLEQLRVSDS
jgi:nucleoside-diphosphate-sugar epimerase